MGQPAKRVQDPPTAVSSANDVLAIPEEHHDVANGMDGHDGHGHWNEEHQWVDGYHYGDDGYDQYGDYQQYDQYGNPMDGGGDPNHATRR